MYTRLASAPVHGNKSKTRLYRALYTAIGPLLPVLRRFFPKDAATTEKMGLAMLKVAKHGATKSMLESSGSVQVSNLNTTNLRTSMRRPPPFDMVAGVRRRLL